MTDRQSLGSMVVADEAVVADKTVVADRTVVLEYQDR